MTIHDIQELVATRLGTTVLDLVSSRRGRDCVRPRHIAMWLCRHTTPASLPEIGRAFGDRDHTTVMHALRRVDARMAAEPGLAVVLEALRDDLLGRQAA